ncbi:MAG TPA: insulinase family protein [Candidatus Eremiobacteraceae bacterium]|nr:insulinase family protein [Candidatus Eremiobacteraceae bacterium]
MVWWRALRILGKRGALAALFFSLACVPPVAGHAASEVAPAAPPSGFVLGQTQLSDGLTLIARSLTASPTAALEIWIRCPATGYGPSRPGIARLAALALLEQKSGDATLREQVRRAGAQIGVSVYHEGTEIAILSPSYLAPAMLDKLTAQILHPKVDRNAYLAARQRLAAQQVAAIEVPDQLLRDALFERIFASGPLHEPTYGNTQTLAGLTLDDVNRFLARAYVPRSEIVIAAGRVDGSDVSRRVAASAPPAAGNSEPIPDSVVAGSAGSAPATLHSSPAGAAGVAIGWVGPPIADEQAATAMDFLSDYLTHPASGVVSQAVDNLDASAKFNGQFITLRSPGVFFISVSGNALDPDAALGTIRDAVKKVLAGQLSKNDFERALTAFRTHLLRDLQTPQEVADNYGWYFTQGATSYSPSATDAQLAGDYFAQVQSLTPAYVFAVAKRYLSTTPTVVLLPRGALHTASDTK